MHTCIIQNQQTDHLSCKKKKEKREKLLSILFILLAQLQFLLQKYDMVKLELINFHHFIIFRNTEINIFYGREIK